MNVETVYMGYPVTFLVDANTNQFFLFVQKSLEEEIYKWKECNYKEFEDTTFLEIKMTVRLEWGLWYHYALLFLPYAILEEERLEKRRFGIKEELKKFWCQITMLKLREMATTGFFARKGFDI